MQTKHFGLQIYLISSCQYFNSAFICWLQIVKSITRPFHILNANNAYLFCFADYLKTADTEKELADNEEGEETEEVEKPAFHEPLLVDQSPVEESDMASIINDDSKGEKDEEGRNLDDYLPASFYDNLLGLEQEQKKESLRGEHKTVLPVCETQMFG